MLDLKCDAVFNHLLKAAVLLSALSSGPCLAAQQSVPTATECVKLLHSDSHVQNKNSDPDTLPDGVQKIGAVSMLSWRPITGSFAAFDNLYLLALSIKDKSGAFAVETALIQRTSKRKLKVLAHDLFYETQLVVEQGEGADSVLSPKQYLIANNVQAFGVKTESWFRSTSTEVSGKTLTLFVPHTSGTIDAIFCRVVESDDERSASTVKLSPPIKRGYRTLTLTSGRENETYVWDGSSYQRSQQRHHK